MNAIIAKQNVIKVLENSKAPKQLPPPEDETAMAMVLGKIALVSTLGFSNLPIMRIEINLDDTQMGQLRTLGFRVWEFDEKSKTPWLCCIDWGK